MDLTDQQVEHKVFGEGNVVEHKDSYVIVDFPSGNKKFVFPDAFDKFLKLTDQKTANLVGKLVKERKQEVKEKERKRKKKRALKAERRRLYLERERMRRRRTTQRIHPSSQSVFWCKASEQKEIFQEWEVFTGLIKSGQKEGQPRKLNRISQNTACLFTARDGNEPEKNRRVVGAFMVQEDFRGKSCEDGQVPAHEKYRLRLTEEEAEKILFWNYYVNKNYPHRMTWNTGRHRYFDNIWMAQILKDIISLRDKSKEKEEVQSFFDYFCRVNQIDKEDIPEPNGALLRV